MAIETLDDIIENIADQLGVYGAHQDDELKACRGCFTSSLRMRVLAAIEVESKLNNTVPPIYTTTVSIRLVSVSREVFNDLNEKMSPVTRFVNVREWKFPHFWLYSPSGSVVIFTCAEIERLESAKLTTKTGEF